MSGKLKSSKGKRIDRPFAPKILAEARALADRYQVVVWFEDGEYHGRGVELPFTFGGGKTPGACVENTRRGFVLDAASMIEAGETPPAPAAEGKRDQQINVRVTSEEKLILESAARRAGAAGLSDFVRSRALAGASKP